MPADALPVDAAAVFVAIEGSTGGANVVFPSLMVMPPGGTTMAGGATAVPATVTVGAPAAAAAADVLLLLLLAGVALEGCGPVVAPAVVAVAAGCCAIGACGKLLFAVAARVGALLVPAGVV